MAICLRMESLLFNYRFTIWRYIFCNDSAKVRTMWEAGLICMNKGWIAGKRRRLLQQLTGFEKFLHPTPSPTQLTYWIPKRYVIQNLACFDFIIISMKESGPVFIPLGTCQNHGW
jgi:hypothetical protein